MTANGFVTTKTARATAATAASRPTTTRAFRRREPTGKRYNAATHNGTASSTALNFVPTASPAITPAASHVPHCPPWNPLKAGRSAHRAASATVAATRKVNTASTAAKWLSWIGRTANAYMAAASRPVAVPCCVLRVALGATAWRPADSPSAQPPYGIRRFADTASAGGRIVRRFATPSRTPAARCPDRPGPRSRGRPAPGSYTPPGDVRWYREAGRPEGRRSSCARTSRRWPPPRGRRSTSR